MDLLLKKKLKQVTEEEAKPIIEKLKKHVDDFNKKGNGCYGLAANQIGIDAAVAYAKIPKQDEMMKALEDITGKRGPEYHEIILINPKIKELEEPYVNVNEGCMSFMGRRVSTKRFKSITFNNYDGKKMCDGLEAIIIQHEIDHINGLTIFDRAINPYPKTDRNEKCPCGSGKKYKHCCRGGKKELS